jgi:hypothetical protein
MKTRFVKLSPEGVMEYWNLIAPEIYRALPTYVFQVPEIMLKLQEQILLGSLHCWISLDIIPENAQVYAIGTTTIVVDPISQTKTLLVYTATTLGDHPIEMWSEAVETLKKFAISKGCKNITAYSSNPRMVQICALQGADVSTTLIKFEV